jgi:hypothetical protein
MMVAAIDHGHVDGLAVKRARGIQAAEASSDDYDMRHGHRKTQKDREATEGHRKTLKILKTLIEILLSQLYVTGMSIAAPAFRPKMRPETD